MFGALVALLDGANEAEWEEGTSHLLTLTAGERQEALFQLHHLATLIGQSVRRLEEKTFELSGLLWKRKRKPGISGLGSKSSHRMCFLRPDGLHYYAKEQPAARLGVVERSMIESVAVLESNPKTFEVGLKNGVTLEFTAESPSLAQDWVAGLRPDADKNAVVKEGWLLKRKAKKLGGAKKRYCVLVSDALKYFDEKGGRCLGAMPLSEVVSSLGREGETPVLKLLHGGSAYLFSAAAPGEDVGEWVNAIARLKVLGCSSFYPFLNCFRFPSEGWEAVCGRRNGRRG
jgi:hypothetical protein